MTPRGPQLGRAWPATAAARHGECQAAIAGAHSLVAADADGHDAAESTESEPDSGHYSRTSTAASIVGPRQCMPQNRRRRRSCERPSAWLVTAAPPPSLSLEPSMQNFCLRYNDRPQVAKTSICSTGATHATETDGRQVTDRAAVHVHGRVARVKFTCRNLTISGGLPSLLSASPSLCSSALPSGDSRCFRRCVPEVGAPPLDLRDLQAAVVVKCGRDRRDGCLHVAAEIGVRYSFQLG